MMNTNGSKSRTVLAGLGLAALGSAGAYGITATGADLTPADEPQEAATAIEYGAHRRPHQPNRRRGTRHHLQRPRLISCGCCSR